MLFKCYTYTLLFRYVPPGFGNKDYIEPFIVLIWRNFIPCNTSKDIYLTLLVLFQFRCPSEPYLLTPIIFNCDSVKVFIMILSFSESKYLEIRLWACNFWLAFIQIFVIK